MEDEKYLGDGVYVSFDGYQLILRATRRRGDHWVELEPSVYANLIEYRAELYERIAAMKQQDGD